MISWPSAVSGLSASGSAYAAWGAMAQGYELLSCEECCCDGQPSRDVDEVRLANAMSRLLVLGCGESPEAKAMQVSLRPSSGNPGAGRLKILQLEGSRELGQASGDRSEQGACLVR